MRTDLRAVFLDTLIRIATDPDWLSLTNSSINRGFKDKVYLDGETETLFKEMYQETPANIIVSKKKTIQATIDQIRSPKDYYVNPCILNFADWFTPGGLVFEGAATQEEDLCRCTDLYTHLIKHYYLFYGCHTGKGQNGLFNGDYIFNGEVHIYKYDQSNDYKVLETPLPLLTSVITCAAPIYKNQISKDELKKLFKDRIRPLLKTARVKGNNTLILGAWGCGAFNNPPEVVAQAFKEVLIDEKLAHCFNEIEFAIYCHEDTTNYDVFKKILTE